MDFDLLEPLQPITNIPSFKAAGEELSSNLCRSITLTERIAFWPFKNFSLSCQDIRILCNNTKEGQFHILFKVRIIFFSSGLKFFVSEKYISIKTNQKCLFRYIKFLF